jgi:uncharacterized protein (UPF0332 family)
MAIVNTLEKCLGSPYLFVDKDAPTRVGKLLALAGDRLEAAVNLSRAPKSDPAEVNMMCHEAMFACIRALVYDKGYREAGLRCLLLAFEKLYIHPGLVDSSHIHMYEKVQALAPAPEESIEAASAFVKKTLEILGK